MHATSITLLVDMYSPETHEQNAEHRLTQDDPAGAHVSALLAVAAAIEKLAEVIQHKDFTG